MISKMIVNRLFLNGHCFTLLVIMGAQYSLMLVLIKIMWFILTKKKKDREFSQVSYLSMHKCL